MPSVKKPRPFAEGMALLPPSPSRSSLLRTWSRRLISVSLYALLLALLLALLPALLVVGWVVDRVRGVSVIVPASLLFTLYLGTEVLAVVIAVVLWLLSFIRIGSHRHRFLRWNFYIQCWWLRLLFGAARRLFRFRVEISGEEAVQRGNMLFFIRHVSTADTLLAGVYVSDRHGIVLRYVLKDELRWDPCVDIYGMRLPNGFVRRGGEREAAVAEVVRLTDDLGPADGVLIYPEGTRFTPAKRARLLARLEERGDVELLARARALTHVLPPRPSGALALLDSADTADVVFCAHAGFEKALGFREFIAGGLSDITVHIGYWRIPRAEIPESREERAQWLHEQWQRVDAWIDEHTPDR